MLLLYNVQSPEGIEIAQYYKQTHPGVKLLGLEGVGLDEEISAQDYLHVIRPQVLTRLSKDTQVIVTTKGLPLRIRNEQSNPGTYTGWRGEQFGVPIYNDWWKPYSSLESELTRIDLIKSSEMMGDQAAFMSPPAFAFSTDHQASNPYYGSSVGFDRANPANEGIRLASRLDGFSAADVIASIDRAQRTFNLPKDQTFILDDDPDAPAGNVDRMPQLATNVFTAASYAFQYDNTDAAITDAPLPVIGYVSHGKYGSGDNYIDGLNFELANGAVFHTWESYNAISFEQGANKYGQGLIGEWIAAGGTAALGHVQEPGAAVNTVANEDIFWQMMLNGFTLAEAAWAATPQLSYVNTVVGDPLMRLAPWVPGDVDLNGTVGVNDLATLLGNWNEWGTGGVSIGDLNHDGYVGMNDLNFLLDYWSNSTSTPSSVVIPEPGIGCLWITGITCLGLTRRLSRA